MPVVIADLMSRFQTSYSIAELLFWS